MSIVGMKGASGSFYVAGGTLSRDARCYVERRADQDLYESLRQGNFCYVLTARQMGKSSLMVRTAARLREEGVGVAVLDLTALGQNLSAEQWYGGLLTQMGDHLDLLVELEEFWRDQPQLGPLQRWMQSIRKVVLPRYPGAVFVFVDEIDVVRSLPFSTDEFFAGIRELHNGRSEDPELERLTFCLLGVATPSDLIRDTRMTPFNIGQRIELHDFTEAEAHTLARGLGPDEPADSVVLRRIFYWTGGHPYLTQRLCQAVVEEGREQVAGEVDRLCEGMFLSAKARERDDNLIFVRERLLRSEVDVAGLLKLYEQVHQGRPVGNDPTSPLVSVLRLSGITREEQGLLKVRNRAYERAFDREWIKENMPDAEVRRQRAAYWKGVLRTAAIAILVVAAIGILAIFAFRQRNRAQGQEEVNRRQLYAAHMNLARQAWDEANVPRMMELVNSHWPSSGQEDLRGFEWYLLWRLGQSSLRSFQHSDVPDYMSVAFSPDGKTLATASYEKLKLWDVSTGRIAVPLEGHTKECAVTLSANGRFAATQQFGCKAATVWEVSSGREVGTLEGHSEHCVVAIRPDGKRVATLSSDSDDTLKLWDVVTGNELNTLRGLRGFYAFSVDGKKLATAGRDEVTIKLWDAESARELMSLKGHRGIQSVVFSGDGRTLASAGRDSTVRLWEVATGRQLKEWNVPTDAIYSLAFSPDDKVLAAGATDLTARLWEISSGKSLAVIKGHRISVTSVAFSPNGKLLATGGWDGVAMLWDLAANQEEEVTHTDQNFQTLAFSPDGLSLAIGSFEAATVRLLDTRTLVQQLVLYGDNQSKVLSVRFSPDGKVLAVAGLDGTVRLWDVRGKKELASLKGSDVPLCLAFAPDGSKIAVGYRYSMTLWNTHTLKEMSSPILAAGPLAFSPDGTALATNSGEGIRLWDVGTGREVLSFQPREQGYAELLWGALTFSPDGTMLASSTGDSDIKLWKVATGRQLIVLKGHKNIVTDLIFFPDKRRLASASVDGTVRIWDVTSGQELMSLKGHNSMVKSLVLSPTGQTLVSAGKSIRFWRAASEEEVRQESTRMGNQPSAN